MIFTCSLYVHHVLFCSFRSIKRFFIQSFIISGYLVLNSQKSCFFKTSIEPYCCWFNFTTKTWPKSTNCKASSKEIIIGYSITSVNEMGSKGYFFLESSDTKWFFKRWRVIICTINTEDYVYRRIHTEVIPLLLRRA